jgi:Protein of unknown function (DUF2516)
MNVVGSVQGFVLLLLGIAALGLTGYASFHAVRYRSNLYPAVGRQTKLFWVGILLAAFGIAIVSFFAPLGFLNVAGVVAASIFLADVRPKLEQVSGGGGRSGMGPYGPY